MERRIDSANSKKKKAGDYRGVTLMSTLHKMYMRVLAKRLREEVEEKGIIPGNQTGFRKEMER